jgi:hypothetical protein
MIPNVDVNTNANIKSLLLYPFVSCELGIQVNCLQEHHVPRQVWGGGGRIVAWSYGEGTQLQPQGIQYASRIVGVRQGLVDHESNAK